MTLTAEMCFSYSTVEDCGALKAPVNGSLVGNLTTYPHKVQFMCDEGFNLRGPKIRRCLPTGDWSGHDSFCEGSLIMYLKDQQKKTKDI